MKVLLGALLILSAAAASAQVTCKENVMTGTKFCSSNSVIVGRNSYFFATNDPGTEPRLVFNFGGLNSSSRPDGVMVKLDDGAPFKMTGSHLRPDVSCRGGRGSCVWTVTAVAKPDAEHLEQLRAASRMLVSFTEGGYVSDPFEVDPRLIIGWIQEWKPSAD